MSIPGLASGEQTYLVGVEDDPSGAIKVYVGHRSRGVYALVADPDAQRQIREAWAGGGEVHIPTPPPTCLLRDDPADR